MRIPTVGILRLAWKYNSKPGDVIDKRTSEGQWRLVEAVIDGLDFETCKKGILNEHLKENIRLAVRNLEIQGKEAISESCSQGEV